MQRVCEGAPQLPPQLLDLATPPAVRRDLLHCTGLSLQRLRDWCFDQEGGAPAPIVHELDAQLRTLWSETEAARSAIDDAVAHAWEWAPAATGQAAAPSGAYVRVMRYVDTEEEPATVATRLPAHADPGAWTLLLYPSLQQNRGPSSLEVHVHDRWMPVDVPPGCAVLMPGLMLAEASGGAMQGLMHRVVDQPGSSSAGHGRSRFALGLFSYTRLRPNLGLPDFHLSTEDVMAHWELITAICAAAHDPCDHSYWTPVFRRYKAFLRLQGAEQARATQQGVPIRILRPPTDLYHCWLVHMLQPDAYRKDCVGIVDAATGWFGTISHLFTAADLADLEQTSSGGTTTDTDAKSEPIAFKFLRNGDAAFRQAWESAYGFEYSSLDGDNHLDPGVLGATLDSEGPLFEFVDWWKGNDTLRTLHCHVSTTTPDILLSKAALTESILDYRRFVHASLNSDALLAPGAAIDLCWHTHQTNPMKYARDMRSLSGTDWFLDHNPCGEENPPQREWMDASMETWRTLYGEGARLPRGVGALDDIGCCCCSTGDWGNAEIDIFCINFGACAMVLVVFFLVFFLEGLNPLVLLALLPLLLLLKHAKDKIKNAATAAPAVAVMEQAPDAAPAAAAVASTHPAESAAAPEPQEQE